jgi:LIM homeobox protein 2/9
MSISDKVCSGCLTFIDDPAYLMTVDHHWHLSCLKCFDCGISFKEDEKCFTRYGQIFCKDDYIKYVARFFSLLLIIEISRRYCSRICTRCNRKIEQDEEILRVQDNIYHLNCFTCLSCNTLLHPGDEFGLKENLIFCRNHLFEEQSKKILDDSGYNTSPNERQKEYFVSISSDERILFSYQNRSQQQKRLRTSFKHQQIRYMRSYFNLNHNPGLNLLLFLF